MRVVVQRVKWAQVEVGTQVVGRIENGLFLLVGIACGDSKEQVAWMARKTAALRIFCDEDGRMNRSLVDTGGQALVVSQFTLLGELRSGNRPSFVKAAPPEAARALINDFCAQLEALLGSPVATGVFGASMQVSLCNDGPVTIVVER